MFFLVVFLASVSHALPISYFFSTKQVVDAKKYLGAPESSSVLMSRAEAVQAEPVLPFVPWGLRFDEDLMISLHHDKEWGMIEVAKVNLPNNEALWFTLDSKSDGRQFVGLPADPRAKKYARVFPAKSYEANLRVREKLQGRKTQFSVEYTRMDGRKIAFQMRAPNRNKPPRKRNGNAMNHSQGQVLALLDIFSLRLRKPKWTGKPLRVQRILGIPIAGRMRQVVGGLRWGQWQQVRGKLMPQISGSGAYSFQITKDERSLIMESQGLFPKIRYLFDIVGKQYQLRRIELQQQLGAKPEAPIVEFDFNPSLPDLRYGQPQQVIRSKMTMAVNGRPGYQQGEVFLHPLQTGGIRVEVRSLKPKWANYRPLFSWLTYSDDGVDLRSTVLAAGGQQRSKSTLSVGSKVQSVWSFANVDMRWQKTPHRLSTLKIFSPAQGQSAVAQIGGGTWASGEIATDTAVANMQSWQLSGAEFYSVKTPNIPMLQPASMEKVVQAKQELVLQNLECTGKVYPWIQGFGLQPGPFHQNTGITIRGFRVALENILLQDNQLKLTVVLEQYIGSVPDRLQKMPLYSALGQVQIGLLCSKQNPTYFDLSNPWRRKGGLLQDASPVKQTNAKPGLLQEYKLQVTTKNWHSGRYVRALGISAHQGFESDIFDNAGAITRETEGVVTKRGFWLQQLQSKEFTQTSGNPVNLP